MYLQAYMYVEWLSSAAIHQSFSKSWSNNLERCHSITRNKKVRQHHFEHWTLHGADSYRLRGVIRNVSYKADCWGYKWKSCHISRVNSKFSFPEHALPSCLFPGTSVVKEKKQLWGTTTVYVHALGLLYWQKSARISITMLRDWWNLETDVCKKTSGIQQIRHARTLLAEMGKIFLFLSYP